MQNPLKKLFKRALRKPKSSKYIRNTAILNGTPKEHVPRKRKIVQK